MEPISDRIKAAELDINKRIETSKTKSPCAAPTDAYYKKVNSLRAEALQNLEAVDQVIQKAKYLEVKSGSTLHANEKHPNYEYLHERSELNEIVEAPDKSRGWVINKYIGKNGVTMNDEYKVMYWMRLKPK